MAGLIQPTRRRMRGSELMELETYRRLLESLRAEVLSSSPNRADPVRDGNEMADEDVQPLTEMSQACLLYTSPSPRD